MKASKLLIAASVAALIPMGAAVAGEGMAKDKSAAAANFQKLDANKDGRISQAEAAVDSTIMFSTADANGDGYLDSTEWKASHRGSSGHEQQPQSAPSEVPAGEQPVTPPSDVPAPDTETPRQ